MKTESKLVDRRPDYAVTGWQKLLVRWSLAMVLLGSFVVNGRAQGYPGHWQGEWIWDEGAPMAYNYFLMARRSLDLDAGPSAASLKITAADRYALYVNGTYVGRGPARSDPRWTSFDTYDVASYLRKGRNSIAVLAYHYGAASNYTRDARAGFVRADRSKTQRWIGPGRWHGCKMEGSSR